VSEPAPTPHADAEYRQITAVSCELVGVTGRSEGIDLEELREAIGAFQRRVSKAADRHNGLLARCFGSNVLVLFGYPAAHEYDAEQAVRAGLELCAAVGGAEVPIQCRVGIATGMVIIGDIVGVGELRECEIVGEAPGLAARLRRSAQPGSVAIDPATRRLTGNLFDCRDLGAIDANSGTKPIHRWRVLGESIVASRFEALRAGALPPLVGREEELALLLRRWQRVTAGDGQVVLLSGEPGIGKSRLAAQLAAEVANEPHTRLRYQCSPYHRDSVLHPFAVALGRSARLAAADPPGTQLDKL
jgi:class 3 adenylate cyclase